jgi:hypothetical protein
MIITLKSAGAPGLRFDKTAVGFVRRLQKALRKSIPIGKTLIVTCTAPIRQDSKTSRLLEAELGRLVASRKKKLQATILGNRIQARVLNGGNEASPLLGFIHNPDSGPEMLFRLTQAVVRALDAGTRMAAGEALVIRNQAGRVPVQALKYICTAVRAQTAFRRILVLEDGKLKSLRKAR